MCVRTQKHKKKFKKDNSSALQKFVEKFTW